MKKNKRIFGKNMSQREIDYYQGIIAQELLRKASETVDRTEERKAKRRLSRRRKH